jgi:hypothetical protein
MTTEDITIPPALTAILKRIGEAAVTTTEAEGGTALQAHVSGVMRVAAYSVAAFAGLPPCQLASPHAGIQTAFDSQGNLRFECLHTPMHCWDLEGHKGTC